MVLPIKPVAFGLLDGVKGVVSRRSDRGSLVPAGTIVAIAAALWLTATLAMVKGLSGATMPVAVAPGHVLPRPEIATAVIPIKQAPFASDERSSVEEYRALKAMRERFAAVIAETDHISLLMLPPTMEMTEIEKSDRLLLARRHAFSEPQAFEILRDVLLEAKRHREQASRAVNAHEKRSIVDDVDPVMTASVPTRATASQTLALGYASPASANVSALGTDESELPFVELLSEPPSDHITLPEAGPLPSARPQARPPIQRIPAPEAPAVAQSPEKPKKTLLNMLAYAKPDNPITTDDGAGGIFNRKSKLPGPGSRIAVYVIEDAVVHMPNGDKLRAHSGRGHMRDNPNYVHVKNKGATPPNVYSLRMREARFHGVEAIRMTPVGSAPMFNRDGFLTHTYLLRRRGDSSGCVVFENYDHFLNAFKRGDVKTLVVVPSMRELPRYMAML
ncbi:DUF2778 domain-containing protein [Peteryoungia desertarenae]|uniref:DUF2778 domain-containing protein n=1 Tax=Peteryoungia desertarenae TaxID=1813451 RepID=A0ABX6QLE9_9HYPH|nr:DUF2778 domain-containing protein [Peteryoungia desertarenae]QLF69401.1 DUF2778 domain-containing protein [Peteryoungia desertarenae]